MTGAGEASGGDLVRVLPHRPPMLLLDAAEQVSERCLVAHQEIPTDSPFLAGHFPGLPVWPGALLAEAMAQTTAVYLLHSRAGLRDGEVPVLGALDCHFLRPVFPGDRITYRAELIRRLADLGLFAVTARRGTQVVARARITAGVTLASRLLDGSR